MRITGIGGGGGGGDGDGGTGTAGREEMKFRNVLVCSGNNFFLISSFSSSSCFV